MDLLAGIAAENGFRNTFSRRTRKPSLGQLQAVHVRSAVFIQKAVDTGSKIRSACIVKDHVKNTASQDAADLVFRAEACEVFLRYAHRGTDIQVKQAVLPDIAVRGIIHIRRSRRQTGHEAGSESNNKSDGKKPVKAFPDIPYHVFPSCLSHMDHHSIVSTGAGEGLRSIERIFPLLIRMTLSAICVRALL